jgi:hypothetical protein
MLKKGIVSMGPMDLAVEIPEAHLKFWRAWVQKDYFERRAELNPVCEGLEHAFQTANQVGDPEIRQAFKNNILASYLEDFATSLTLPENGKQTQKPMERGHPESGQ